VTAGRPDWDPGWKQAILGGMVPFGLRRARRRGTDPLTMDRVLLITQASSLVYLGIALLFLGDLQPGGNATLFWWVVVLAGVVMHAALGPTAIRGMVRADEESVLVVTYRAGMFIGIGLSAAVALLAFACVLMGNERTLYPIGLACALVGFWRIAPSQRVFAHCDALLLAQGKTIRMTEAWRRAVTEPPETTG
jgi:hypothetical protein